MKKLNEVFPNWLTGTGIFSFLGTQSVPWPSTINAELDLAYHGNHSGQKGVTPLVTALLDDTETISTANATRLASLAVKLYGPYWSKEYATLSLVYNPISNYDMTETERGSTDELSEDTHTGTDNRSLTNSKTGTDTLTKSDTHTGTDTLSKSETHTGTDTTVVDRDVSATNTGTNSNGIYGYNSGSSPVPADVQTGNNSGTQAEDETTTKTLDLADAGTDTRTLNLTDAGTDRRTLDLSDSGTDNRTVNLTDNGTKNSEFTRTLSRSGNIGVTTSQQMLASERELWLWNFFEKVVFPDLDKILCMMIY